MGMEECAQGFAYTSFYELFCLEILFVILVCDNVAHWGRWQGMRR